MLRSLWPRSPPAAAVSVCTEKQHLPAHARAGGFLALMLRSSTPKELGQIIFKGLTLALCFLLTQMYSIYFILYIFFSSYCLLL